MTGRGILRFSLWWQHIVPPVLATACVAAAMGALPPEALVGRLVPFLLSVVGVAGFGYFLNDVCDVAADRAAGKENAAQGRTRLARAGLLCALLALGLVPWLVLPRNPANLTLLAAEIAALALYSVRPFRLKERGLAGPLADMLYGHLLPVGIAIFTFFPRAQESAPRGESGAGELSWRVALGVLLALALAAKGLRNILLHQLADRWNDRRSGTHTVVLAIGPLRALALINRVLLPLELGALAGLLAGLAPVAPVWVGFAVFLAFTALKFSAWKFPFIPKRQLRLKFLYFLNDFYEEWLAPTVLVILCLRFPEVGWLWWLLPLHFALFPRGLAKLPRDLSVLRENFANAADF
jgi:4-hydroxybenzoate polyprenyltransferase